MTYFWIYPLLFLSSMINIIVPISGSAVVTPLLSVPFGAKEAIALASFLFVITGLFRIFLFRKHLKVSHIKNILPLSIIGAAIGALTFVRLDNLAITLLIIGFLSVFLVRKVHNINRKGPLPAPKKITGHAVGFISGLVQGAGVTGGVDLRNGFLLSHNLTLQELNGTTAVIGTTNFAVATLLRLYTNQISFPDLTKVLWILPLMFVAMLIGRKLTFHIGFKQQNYLAVFILVFAIFMMLISLFRII